MKKVPIDSSSVKAAAIEKTIEYVDYLRNLTTKNKETKTALNDVIVSLEDLLGCLSGVPPELFSSRSRKRPQPTR